MSELWPCKPQIVLASCLMLKSFQAWPCYIFLSKEMHCISPRQHSMGVPRDMSLRLGVVVWQVSWHGSSLLAFGWVLKQVTQSPWWPVQEHMWYRGMLPIRNSSWSFRFHPLQIPRHPQSGLKGMIHKKGESEVSYLLLAFILVGCIGSHAFLCEDFSFISRNFKCSCIQMTPDPRGKGGGM